MFKLFLQTSWACVLSTAALLVICLAQSAHAEVYRCSVKGKTTYTDKPCTTQSQPAKLPEISTYKAPALTPKAPAAKPKTVVVHSTVNWAQKQRSCNEAHARRVEEIRANYWRPSQDAQRDRALSQAQWQLSRCMGG